MLSFTRIALSALPALLLSLPVQAAERWIALTFDDGPRPYVLLGVKGQQPAPGLLDVLDQNGAKATFFVVGWRLSPRTWGDKRYEKNIGVTCVDALREALKRGHEVEDHTYSHEELQKAEKKNGEKWVLEDVEKGAEAIKAVTGSKPLYLRPPDWVMPNDARHDLESRGYHLLNISSHIPAPLRDVNTLDYLCARKNSSQCPGGDLAGSVMKQIQAREKKGVYSHILAFHELSSTTAILPKLLAKLKESGYQFVTLQEYMDHVGKSAPTAAGF